MNKVNSIEALYSINTPMFLGSADNKIAEIRPTSFKGILRFWFRALALAEFNGDLAGVARLEGIIFGKVSEGGSQKALYSLKIQKNNIIGTGINIKEEKEGIIYLGYGPIRYVKRNGKKGGVEYTRNYIDNKGSLKVILIQNTGIKNKIARDDFKNGKNLLIKTLKVIGLFGGLGSRVRNGFGSISLKELKNNGEELIDGNYCNTKDTLVQEIKELLKTNIEFDKGIDDIEYTAFSKSTRVVITESGNDPIKLLDNIGKEMLNYRSYRKSEKNFKDDHDLVYDYINGKKIDRHPRRVVFGLPHNYKLTRKKTYINVSINSANRRASPLFIHIHKMANESYIGILSMIPSRFLKDDDAITISESGERPRIEAKKLQAKVEYKVIEDFLDRIINELEGIKIL